MSANRRSLVSPWTLTARPSAADEALLYQTLKAKLSALGCDDAPTTLEDLKARLANVIDGTEGER